MMPWFIRRLASLVLCKNLCPYLSEDLTHDPFCIQHIIGLERNGGGEGERGVTRLDSRPETHRPTRSTRCSKRRSPRPHWSLEGSFRA
jgi:hypothetical protein